jgi:hypothetical protein
VVVTVRVGPNTLLFPLLARGELDVVVGALPGPAALAAAGPSPRAWPTSPCTRRRCAWW